MPDTGSGSGLGPLAISQRRVRQPDVFEKDLFHLAEHRVLLVACQHPQRAHPRRPSSRQTTQPQRIAIWFTGHARTFGLARGCRILIGRSLLTNCPAHDLGEHAVKDALEPLEPRAWVGRSRVMAASPEGRARPGRPRCPRRARQGSGPQRGSSRAAACATREAPTRRMQRAGRSCAARSAPDAVCPLASMRARRAGSPQSARHIAGTHQPAVILSRSRHAPPYDRETLGEGRRWCYVSVA
jgi:hypothetical protein